MQIDRATELRDLRLFGALRVHYDPFGTGAKIGSVRLPNFKENNEGCTKTEPTRSDEEILKAVAELAKRHAEKGTFQNADNEYLDLYKEYVSSVSPDREGILTSSLNQIFGKTNTPKKDKEGETNILQQTLKSMEYAKSKIKTKNSNKTSSGALHMYKTTKGDMYMYKTNSGAMYDDVNLENGELKFARFFDSNGNMIADYTQNGWSLFGTKEEVERGYQFTAVYNEAFNSVYNAPTPSMPKHLEGGTTIDVVG
jgi:hypothetical protein